MPKKIHEALQENLVKDKQGFTVEIKLSWCKQDVVEQARNNHEVELTDEEAGDVLDACLNDHDATIGVNWDVIDYHITQVVNERG